MAFLMYIAYVSIGGALCWLCKAYAGECFKDSFTRDDYGTLVAIITGVAWPLVAPFTFAVLLAKKRIK